MKLLFLFLMVFTLTFIAHAEEEGDLTSQAGKGLLQEIFPLSEHQMTLPDFAERLSITTTSDVNTSDYVCRAWTTCPRGYQISCWSRGYRCYAEIIRGHRVYCSASDRYGRTRWVADYCR